MHRRKPSVAVTVAPAPQPPVTNEQQYFRVNEAARYLRTTISSIRLAYRDGSLQGRIVGKRLIFSKESLDVFFNKAAA